MRRWFELGYSNTLDEHAFITARPSSRSGRFIKLSTSEPSGQAAFFVSMPHKQDVVSMLSDLSATLGHTLPFYIEVWSQDQGVDPLPLCPAQHIPRNMSHAFPQITFAGPAFRMLTVEGFSYMDGSGVIVGNTNPILTLSTDRPRKA